MNYNEEKKKGNGLLVVVIILSVILIGVGSVIIYQNYHNKNDNLQDVGSSDKVDDDELENDNSESNGKNDNNSEEKLDDSEIIGENTNNNNQTNLENELVEIYVSEADKLNCDKLYENIFPGYYDYYGIHIEGINYGFYYHNADLRVVEDMPHKIKLSIVANYVVRNYDEYFTGELPVVPESILKDAYYTIFGNDGYYFEELENCPGFTKKYDGLKEGEVFFPGCGDSGMPGLETEIIKYEKNSSNNELYIYEVVGFFGYLGDLFNLYKDYSKTELVVENVSYDKLNLLTYKDKLNTYKYTFKYKDNGDSETNWRDYYFYSVERVK